MSEPSAFHAKLEQAVRQQLQSQRVGYLLGAGSSYLDGGGYPLTSELWICEEAHAYIPRTSTSEYAGARKSMERIAKEGRKYGVGLGVVSQRPHEVSETVLAQCGTFVCLRITNPDDQGYVRKLVPESEGDLVSILAGLGRGEALALGEAVPLPTRIQFDRPNPAPNSDDIDFHGKWSTEQAKLDVDAIVHRWRSQER